MTSAIVIFLDVFDKSKRNKKLPAFLDAPGTDCVCCYCGIMYPIVALGLRLYTLDSTSNTVMISITKFSN
jgi:hypothetical protein